MDGQTGINTCSCYANIHFRFQPLYYWFELIKSISFVVAVVSLYVLIYVSIYVCMFLDKISPTCFKHVFKKILFLFFI